MKNYSNFNARKKAVLESKLKNKLQKTKRQGLQSKLMRGEDVEKHVANKVKTNVDKSVSDLKNQTVAVLTKQSQKTINDLTQRVDNALRYAQTNFDAKLKAIPKPKDGKTPTKKEIEAVLKPVVGETQKDFEDRLKKLENLFSDTTEPKVPQDLAGFEKLVKQFTPKQSSGGGGANYLFDLEDTPKKAKGRQGAYKGYEGQALKVSEDGKRLEFGVVGSTLTVQELDGSPSVEVDTIKFPNGTLTDNGDGSASFDPGSLGGGDMNKITYDPNSVEGDAFDMDNMVEGADTKILTAAERTKLSNTSGTNTGDQDLSEFETTTELNARDTANRSRSNHTGSQAISTVTGLQTALDGTVKSVVAGTNVTVDATDPENPVVSASASGGISDGDKGDITVSGSGATWTIDNDAVTFDKIQNIATNRVLARSSSGTGSVEDLTLPNFRNLINVENGATADQTGAEIEALLDAELGSTDWKSSGGSAITYSATAPSSPSDGDLWMDTSEVLDEPVRSETITNVVVVTQAQYDALTPDASTLYYIA